MRLPWQPMRPPRMVPMAASRARGSGRLYKIVGPNGEPLHGGSGAWPLPSAEQPIGAWRAVEGDVQLCHNGLHLTDARNLRRWLQQDAAIYRAEPSGAMVAAEDKVAVQRARLLWPPMRIDTTAVATAEARALAAHNRAVRSADRAYNRAARVALPNGVTAAVAEYALRMRHRLPTGHPLRMLADTLHAPRDAQRAAIAAAAAAYDRAIARAWERSLRSAGIR
jgi:hypothetical protein